MPLGGGKNVRFDGPGEAMRRVFAVVVAAVFLLAPALADAAPTRVTASQESGYGRIAITFPETAPTVEAEVSSGVVVLSFSEVVSFDVDRIRRSLPGYVSAIRRDPDGRSVRFALTRPVRVETTPAAERLFVDLLPTDWSGPPPGLPASVIDELARRAEEAKRLRREANRERPPGTARVPVDFVAMPTFGRFVFTPDQAVPFSLSRDASGVTVTVGAPSAIVLGDLEAQRPDYVAAITRTASAKRSMLHFAVSPAVDVRDFREDDAYVVDLVPPAGYRSAEMMAQKASGEGEPPAATPADDGAAQDNEAAVAGSAPFPALAQAEAAAPAPAGAMPETVLGPTLRAERQGDRLDVTINFDRPVATAVFERMQVLWIVLDTEEGIDPAPVEAAAGDLVTRVEHWRAGGATILRLELSRPLLIGAESEESRLVVHVGGHEPAIAPPLEFVRALAEDGNAVGELALPGAGKLHAFDDPKTGGRLLVVPAVGPARSMPKTQRYVDFTLWPTAHALAVEQVSDGVSVLVEDGTVRILRPGGLALSAAGAKDLDLLSREEAAAATRPGLVRLEAGLTPGEARLRIAEQIRAASAAPDIGRGAERLALARTYLGLGMGAEALGALELALEDAGPLAKAPSMRALRGVALLQMHRPAEALQELQGFDLSQSTDVALWRGLAEAQLRRWEEALKAFDAGRPALATYPPEHQRELLLAEAEAQLETGRVALAAAALQQASDLGLEENARGRLLGGRLAELGGDNNRAMAAYEEVGWQDPPLTPAAAEAKLRKALLARKMGEIGEKETIEELERLTLNWRGDEIEYAATRSLAGVYARAGQYRRAFELMRTALSVEPESGTLQGLQDDMTVVFEDLFLGESADKLSPGDALALYYDFKEMTPIGRKGDEMIRALAERLVGLDLLAQAADLLQYQVDNRLTGAARAQVATRLAAIYLMDRQPADALRVLAGTRIAHLPSPISQERLVLEARALGETGRADLALDLLGELPDDPSVSLARAGILWSAERWQEAGEEYELLLGERWSGPQPLKAPERSMVLRAGIAYAMARDGLGTQRLREKFLDKMADSEDATAFAVVTRPLAAGEGEIGEVVRDLGDTDEMRAMLEEIAAGPRPNG